MKITKPSQVLVLNNLKFLVEENQWNPGTRKDDIFSDQKISPSKLCNEQKKILKITKKMKISKPSQVLVLNNLKFLVGENWLNPCTVLQGWDKSSRSAPTTVFPRIVSAETIFL